eukprot:INCI9990.1.p1 GENE.INCI9990.1~~INCI9990.1.p1  ORF type:complete len:515 (-),score=77.97 INCI9990.1:613-2157(-)
MGSGAQSSPARHEARPEVEEFGRVVAVEHQATRSHTRLLKKHESHCVSKFESFTVDEEFDERSETPRYSATFASHQSVVVRTSGSGSSSRNASGSREFLPRRVKTDVSTGLSSSGGDSDDDDDDNDDDDCAVTPVASNNFMVEAMAGEDPYSPTMTPSFRSTRTSCRHGSHTHTFRGSGNGHSLNACGTGGGGNDDHDNDHGWNLDADVDVRQRDGHGNVVGPNTVLDKSMLGRTLTFRPKEQQNTLCFESHKLRNDEIALVRDFVSVGLWQGNAFCIGMIVAVSAPSTTDSQGSPAGSTDSLLDEKRAPSQNTRLAVVVAAHRRCYDVSYDLPSPISHESAATSRSSSDSLPSFSSESSGSMTLTAGSGHSGGGGAGKGLSGPRTAVTESKLPSSFSSRSSESKSNSEASQDLVRQRAGGRNCRSHCSGGRSLEVRVEQARLSEPAEFKEANEALRCRALEAASNVLYKTSYPLTNKQLCDEHQKTHWRRGDDDKFHPEGSPLLRDDNNSSSR